MKIATSSIASISALLLLFVVINTAGAQQLSPWDLPDERLFVESKWKYTYTLHLESNTIIHKADNNYDYYLYFRYDNTYQQYLNGKFSRGAWQLDARTLHYSFQNADRFTIAQLSKNKLVLEFKQPNSRGTYQYHFVRVSSSEAPFVKPSNELPEVIVEAEQNVKKSKAEKKKGFWSWFRRKDKAEPNKPEPVYINIELVGGGYYGGIDPVLKDYIRIKTDGRLIQEFQTVRKGLMVNKKNIPREELEQFIEWVVKQRFFEMDKVYDCTDPLCFQRKTKKPTPVPLRLSITYGIKKKVVTVAIWGEDDRKTKYVDYPPQLDNIIDAIQRMASRMEDPLVKK
ncbi:MAG: hypothetical protein Kow0027_04960 [Saprospiraceae bacterium]